MKKLLAPLLLTLAFLLLGGCSSNTEVMTAGLRIDVVRLQRAGNGDVQVIWRVRNPNVVSYVLTKAALKLSLDGTAAGMVQDEVRFGIPAQNQAEQTSMLRATDPAALQAVNRALQQGSAAYTVDASLWLLIVDREIEKFHLSGAGTLTAGQE